MNKETKKRIKLIDNYIKQFEPISKGILLASSLAYGPNTAVNQNSDLDILVFTSTPLKSSLSYFIKDVKEVNALKNHRFDGFCLKNTIKNVPVSLHIFDDISLFNISKSYISNLHVYRESAKNDIYTLNNFAGTSYAYKIKNISYPDIHGSRTIVPIMFRQHDIHYLGIHRDKILSGSKILFDSNNTLLNAIESTWHTVVETLIDESKRKYSDLNLEKFNILNALNRKDRFDSDVKQNIIDKTEEYLSKFK